MGVEAFAEVEEIAQPFSTIPEVGDAQDQRFLRFGADDAEAGCVDAVMNHYAAVVFEERFADVTVQPSRDGDYRQPVAESGDEFLTVCEMFCGLCDFAVFRRAVLAPGFPLVARRELKIGAAAGEGPAVVESPDDRRADCREILEKEWIPVG